LPFDWREYLNLADSLNGVARPYTPEATSRTIVSRAYYAAFCHARNYAVANQNFVPQGIAEDHRNLRQHFRGQNEPTIASHLDLLRDWRNKCDYDNTLPVPHLTMMVGASLRAAREVLGRCP
jgi:hypothetical protein